MVLLYVLDWDTEIRVCGPSFYHLMGNLCNTTNIELGKFNIFRSIFNVKKL
jgi:hypothetical protein